MLVRLNGLPRTSEVLTSLLECRAFGLGAQLFVSARGELVADAAFGEGGSGLRLQTDTAHPLACLAKPFLVVALLRLVDSGRLSLDDTLSAYLPTEVAPETGGLRISQVLNHEVSLVGPGGADVRMIPPQNMPMILAATRVRFEPSYSEFVGWYLLCRIVESVSGCAADEFVRREIAVPLGIDGAIALTGDRCLELQKFGRLDVPIGGLPVERLPFAVQTTWEWFRFVSVALGGFVTAGALGSVLGSISDCVFGRPNVLGLRAQTVESALGLTRRRVWDHSLRRECSFAGGFMADMREHLVCKEASARSYGQVAGWYPSAAFFDLERDVVISFMFNGVVQRLEDLTFVRESVCDAVLADIEQR